MIDYKKKLKFILFFIIIILVLYFIFFKIKIFNLKNTNVTTNKSNFYSEPDKLKDVIVFYGDPQADKLKSFSTKIQDAGNITNQIKQILMRLFESVPQGYVRVIPEGTTVREVFIDTNSILYIDLSEEFMINNKGGTTFEYLSIYSILKTIFSNFKEVRGIKFLINGIEQETISGHLSISDIFRPGEVDF